MNENLGQQQIVQVNTQANSLDVSSLRTGSLATSSESEDSATIIRESSCQISTDNQTEGVNQCCNNLFSPKLTQIIENNENEESPSMKSFKQQSSELDNAGNQSIPFSTHSDINDDSEAENIQRSSRRRENQNQLPFQISNNLNSSQMLQQSAIQGSNKYQQINKLVQTNKHTRYNSQQQFTTNDIKTSKKINSQQQLEGNSSTTHNLVKNKEYPSKTIKTQRVQSNQGFSSQQSVATARSSKNSLSPRRTSKKGYFSLLFKSSKKSNLRSDSQPKTVEFTDNKLQESNQNFKSDLRHQSQPFEEKQYDQCFKESTQRHTSQQIKQESPTLKKQKISTRNIMVVNGRESNPFMIYKKSKDIQPRFSNVSLQKPQNSLSVSNIKSQNQFDFSKLQEIKEEDNQSQIDQISIQNTSQNQKNFSISSKSNQKYPQKSDSLSKSQKKKQTIKIQEIKNKINSAQSFQETLRKNSIILAAGQQIVRQENQRNQKNDFTMVLSPTRVSNLSAQNQGKRFSHQMIKNSQPVCLKQSIKKIKKELNEICCYDLDHGVDKLRHHHHKIEQEDNLLTEHWRKYNIYKQKHKQIDYSQLWDWQSLVDQIREEPIKCVKYNHALDPGIQNYLQYESIINLSEDGTELIIYNKKPKVNDQLVLESDPILLKQKQEEYQNSIRQKKQIIKKKINELKSQGDTDNNQELKDVVKMYKQTIPDGVCSISSCDSDDSILNSEMCDQQFCNGIIESEIDRIQNNFQIVKSTASCNISEIQNIIFGGQSSRFWLYRKHMLCLDYQILKNDTTKKPKNRRTKMPFYAWQCITLQLKGRMIDLVIKNEKSMSLFLRFLIMATKTLDGNSNSAQGLINYLFNRSCKKRAKVILKERGESLNSDNFLAIVPANEKFIIKKMHSAEVYRQTFFKYQLMKIRIKIGFHAYQKRNTISELIIRQILDSYTELTESQSISPVAQYNKQTLEFFDEIIKGDISQCVLKLMKLNTDPIVIKRKQVLYRQKELRQLGYTCIDHMPESEYKQALQLLFEQQIQTIFQNQLQLKFKAFNILQKQNTKDIDHDHLDQSQACNNHTKHNVNKFSKGFGLFEYSRCHDLFQNVKVNGKNMYVPRDAATQLRHKFNRRVLNEEFIKLKFILGVGALNDIFFIKTILSKIEIAKKQFVLELEEGQEVYIPHDLSCDAYPHSFRYYDPIIQISNQLLSKQSKTYFSFKTEFNLNKIKTSDWQRQWLTNLGIFEAPNQRKQVHKHQVVNVEEGQWELQYTESHHPMDLQKSRYILIDTSEESLQRQALLQLEQEANLEKYSKIPRRYDMEKSIEDRPINFRFCHNQEVNNNQLLNISFKQAFYQSTDMLKNQGQKLHTLQRIQKFIDENLDEIFEQRPRCNKEKLYIQKNWTPNGNPEFHNLIDIECIPENQRTARQKAIVYHEKRIYYKKLIEDYERKLQNRKVRKRVKMLAETARDCDKKLDYNTKNAFLEERIEFTNRYFSYMNDFKHKNAQMQKIRKDLFVINRQLKLRNKLLKKNTDPFDILKAIVLRVKTNKDDGDRDCLKRSTRLVVDYDKKFMELKKKENMQLFSRMNKKNTSKLKQTTSFSAAKTQSGKQKQICERRLSVIG